MFIDVTVYRAQIFAEIDYGNDATEFFHSTRASYASPFMMNTFSKKPLNAAFKDLVTQILKNKNIQEHLNN